LDVQVVIVIGASLLVLAGAGLLVARKRRKPPAPVRRKNSGGIVLMIGLIFSAVLDPKTKIAAEEIDSQRRKRRDAGRENE